jgi:hypothetical protein
LAGVPARPIRSAYRARFPADVRNDSGPWWSLLAAKGGLAACLPLVRKPGADSRPSDPVGYGGSYLDYAGAAAFVARRAQAGDRIVYPARENQVSWLMIGYVLQYLLARDMPNGVPGPA